MDLSTLLINFTLQPKRIYKTLDRLQNLCRCRNVYILHSYILNTLSLKQYIKTILTYNNCKMVFPFIWYSLIDVLICLWFDSMYSLDFGYCKFFVTYYLSTVCILTNEQHKCALICRLTVVSVSQGPSGTPSCTRAACTTLRAVPLLHHRGRFLSTATTGELKVRL